jgi:Xaa-Pro aminopeptidase
MTCSQLWKVGYEAIRHAGLELFEIGRLGHGQGLLPTEPPSVSRDDHTVLRPGMVVSTEPFTRLKDTAIIWEDVHVVTEDGHEQLTHETDRFRELS